MQDKPEGKVVQDTTMKQAVSHSSQIKGQLQKLDKAPVLDAKPSFDNVKANASKI